MLFLSYRRSDCLAASNALRLALVRRYGARAVFRDYEQLEPGQLWPDQLQQGLAGSAVVLALIGKGWDLPRLDEPADWVRQEIEAGLAAKKLLPLLVDGASMPVARWDAGCLLNELPALQALKLRNTDDFDGDVNRLCAVLEKQHPAFADLEKAWRGRFQLEAVKANFVGRETEIEQLKAALLNGGRAGVSALRGMGGVGKTTLAVKVATELIHDFPDGIFTLNLAGTTNPRSAVELVREVIRIYRPTAQAADEGDAPHQFREVLTEQRVLILLDNAGSTAQVKPLLTAAPPTVGFLITSRNTLKFDNLTLLQLDPLPMADAVKLLREVANRGTDAELEAVATLCGRLPLALRVAGDFLRLNDHWLVAKYIADLQAHRLERLADEDDTERDVRMVLQFSLDLLAKRKPEVAARYALLSVFPADFDDAAAQAVLSVDESTWLDTATVLRDRSLLDFTAGRYRVHDLLRLLAGKGLGEEAKLAAELRFAEHYSGVQRECERLYKAGHDNVAVGLKLFDIEAGNIAYGRAWCFARWEQTRDNAIADLITRYALNAQFVHDIRLSPHARKALLEAALPVLQASGATVHHVCTQGRLAEVWQTLGNPDEAMRLLRETVEPLRDAKGDKGLAVHLGRIADILRTRGQLDEALRIRREEQLPVYERLGDVRLIGITMVQIADILRARGQLDEAFRAFEQVVDVFVKLGDVQSIAVVKGQIADILQVRGQLDEALRIWRDEELPVYEQIGDVRSMLICRSNIAFTLQQRNQTGDRAEAVAHLRWALAEAERMQLAEVSQLREWLVQAEGG